MSAGVLVLGGAQLTLATRELLGAAAALGQERREPVTLASLGPGPDEAGAAAMAEAAGAAGAQELVFVATPTGWFEAHAWQAALEGLIDDRRPAVVLAAHSVDSLAYLGAVAARGHHGLATDVLRVSGAEGTLRAWRGAYGERLLAELDFPGKDTVLISLRRGALAPLARGGSAAAARDGGSPARVSRLELALAGRARSERLELRPPPEEAELARADVVLAVGRGAGAAEKIPELERLASRIGATIAASGPPVEAGWVPRGRKVGQSGLSVAPRVYLALGISGAPQHLAGITRARTVIAVNTDPRARIFDVADVGAVADLFEVAAELERRVG
jgi:electron transfer flavoprotein alpha subunit